MTRPLSDVERMRLSLAACKRANTLLLECDSCDAIRERLRALGANPDELPLAHQALSSGALGTPDRNHQCPDCRGLGEVSIYPCPRCLGAGELTANRKPSRESADLSTRKKLSDMRAAGRIGRRS